MGQSESTLLKILGGQEREEGEEVRAMLKGRQSQRGEKAFVQTINYLFTPKCFWARRTLFGSWGWAGLAPALLSPRLLALGSCTQGQPAL